jgi:hypothetical protein
MQPRSTPFKNDTKKTAHSLPGQLNDLVCGKLQVLWRRAWGVIERPFNMRNISSAFRSPLPRGPVSTVLTHREAIGRPMPVPIPRPELLVRTRPQGM